jgi:class 3 adenylate cyclase
MPTLIVHWREDPTFAFRLGQELAAAIPHARLAPLTEGIMSYLAAGRIGEIIGMLNEFIDDGAEPPKMTPPEVGARGGTAVILFTDIVASTALTERMGDAAFRVASRALDEQLRLAIRDAGGTPIEGKVLGDGVMATFPSASQAIGAALRCSEASALSELPLHLGIHAGDVISEPDNVYGGAVNIASRICGLSAPGEILVSDVVRGMARSSAGVMFDDRGDQEMKGVGEAVRVYAVRRDNP